MICNVFIAKNSVVGNADNNNPSPLFTKQTLFSKFIKNIQVK